MLIEQPLSRMSKVAPLPGSWGLPRARAERLAFPYRLPLQSSERLCLEDGGTAPEFFWPGRKGIALPHVHAASRENVTVGHSAVSFADSVGTFQLTFLSF